MDRWQLPIPDISCPEMVLGLALNSNGNTNQRHNFNRVDGNLWSKCLFARCYCCAEHVDLF